MTTPLWLRLEKLLFRVDMYLSATEKEQWGTVCLLFQERRIPCEARLRGNESELLRIIRMMRSVAHVKRPTLVIGTSPPLK